MVKPTNPIKINKQEADTLKNPFAKLRSTDSVKLVVTFQLDTLSNVDTINISLSHGISNHLISAFSFRLDDPKSLPNGKTYSRVGKQIFIDLGQFAYRKKLTVYAQTKGFKGKKSGMISYKTQ